ncbi:MAG: RsmD family RNA methyltransferase [Bacteroidetes bacterium]|nr:RsmD family RNA methyltransferase [Bacteroidota bacterium]
MRIINGTHKGRVVKVPKDLPVRPTTDFAKEGLFNILNNKINYEETKVLDLFSGTGHISLEFASRGSRSILSVDKHFKCVGFLKATSKELKFEIDTIKSDVFDFLKKCNQKFDLIFADPPYEMENIPTIHQLVFDKQLLNENGILIIEHGPRTNLETLPGFVQKRSYGNVNFSFFENTQNS